MVKLGSLKGQALKRASLSYHDFPNYGARKGHMAIKIFIDTLPAKLIYPIYCKYCWLNDQDTVHCEAEYLLSNNIAK